VGLTIILIWGENFPVDPAPSLRTAAVYVCLCIGDTEREIRAVAAAGGRTLPELTMRTGCGATCGSCLEMAAQLLEQVHAVRELPLPVLSHAA
jgi:bacterioferritin-associated ferredoxin